MRILRIQFIDFLDVECLFFFSFSVLFFVSATFLLWDSWILIRFLCVAKRKPASFFSHRGEKQTYFSRRHFKANAKKRKKNACFHLPLFISLISSNPLFSPVFFTAHFFISPPFPISQFHLFHFLFVDFRLFSLLLWWSHFPLPLSHLPLLHSLPLTPLFPFPSCALPLPLRCWSFTCLDYSH